MTNSRAHLPLLASLILASVLSVGAGFWLGRRAGRGTDTAVVLQANNAPENQDVPRPEELVAREPATPVPVAEPTIPAPKVVIGLEPKLEPNPKVQHILYPLQHLTQALAANDLEGQYQASTLVCGASMEIILNSIGRNLEKSPAAWGSDEIVFQAGRYHYEIKKWEFPEYVDLLSLMEERNKLTEQRRKDPQGALRTIPIPPELIKRIQTRAEEAIEIARAR